MEKQTDMTNNIILICNYRSCLNDRLIFGKNKIKTAQDKDKYREINLKKGPKVIIIDT